jgi:F0F1-type ATP synthase membrane subunit b/b'
MPDPASTDLLGKLGINAPLFLAQLVNFSIVLLVMWKWVYTPLVKLMDKRAQEIADGLHKSRHQATRKNGVGQIGNRKSG